MPPTHGCIKVPQLERTFMRDTSFVTSVSVPYFRDTSETEGGCLKRSFESISWTQSLHKPPSAYGDFQVPSSTYTSICRRSENALQILIMRDLDTFPLDPEIIYIPTTTSVSVEY